MAKRKFGASIIILCIAAVTLISGTYAWFLVGGFAELFDLGFDVIEATGGLWLRGDAGSHDDGEKDNEGWGTKLGRKDFTENSLIPQGGSYRPVSSRDGTNFISVTLENGSNKFTCTPIAHGKQSQNDEQFNPAFISYNDFTFAIKSSEAEIPAGAFMTIKLSGDRVDETTGEKIEEDETGAAIAARVAVTLSKKDGEAATTTVYSFNDDSYEAVTNQFTSEIVDKVEDDVLGIGNGIIDNKDSGYEAAGLDGVTCTKLKDGETWIRIDLGDIPGKDDNGGNGKDITIRIWLEGNDSDCVSFENGAVAGKALLANITFGLEGQ